MLKKLILSTTIALLFIAHAGFAEVREIAITIDDLPFVGSTNGKPGNIQREHDRFYAIMQALKDNNAPAIGFIIAGTIEKFQWDMLTDFKKQGFQLGNHTYSHPDLSHVGADRYIKDISHADQILSPIMTSPKYFRYPYLDESHGATHDKVCNFLAENNYIIAPVTIDSKDYDFNEAYLRVPYRSRPAHQAEFKKRYLAYIWKQTLKATKTSPDKPQILLVHSNVLNSLFLGDVLKMYKDQGYTFITLEEAMEKINTHKSSLPSIDTLEQANNKESTPKLHAS